MDELQVEIQKTNARIQELQRRESEIDAEVESLESDLSDALADNLDAGKIHNRIAKLQSERKALPAAIATLRKRQRELKAQAVEQKRDRQLSELDDAAERLRPVFARAADVMAELAEAVKDAGQFSTPCAGISTSYAALADSLRRHIDNTLSGEKARISFAAHTRAAGWRKAEDGDGTEPAPSVGKAEPRLNLPEGMPTHSFADNRYL